MQEKKEFPYLLIFILLSLLLHLGLAYHYRAWEPAAKALAELRRRQKKDIPIQIIELPKKEKRKEKPKPPPKKPSFLADRNQQTKTETTTEARAPKAAKVKPRPQKPAPPKPTAKPRPKVEPKPATKPKPASQPKATAAAKPRPQIKSPGELSAAKKKETKTEVKKKAQPDIKKLFPSFEELTKISKEQERQNAPTGQRSPHTPNKLKRSTEVALNTLDYKFHSYYLALKRKIELVWEYPYKARRTGVQGRLLIRFVINLDGSLAEVKILRSSGVALLDSEAIRAVHNASPFPPLPKRMNSKRLAVTATFEYLLSYRSVH